MRNHPRTYREFDSPQSLASRLSAVLVLRATKKRKTVLVANLQSSELRIVVACALKHAQQLYAHYMKMV